jgi:hypothetical protein
VSYAEGTSVSVARSRAEIEELLLKYGADKLGSALEASRAVIVFRAQGRMLRFELPLPLTDDTEFTRDPRYSWKKRTAQQAAALCLKEHRRRWRCLLLSLKAKLEACATGITSFEEEFLAHILLPGGETVGQAVAEPIAEAYRTGKLPALLPAVGAP